MGRRMVSPHKVRTLVEITDHQEKLSSSDTIGVTRDGRRPAKRHSNVIGICIPEIAMALA